MLTFDEPTHVYRWDGEVVPSVNQILSDMGFQQGYENIPAYYGRRGTLVHEASVMLDQGTLDMDSLDPRLAPFLLAYQRFCTERDYQPYAWEERFYQSSYEYAGTVDRYAFVDGDPTVIDLKTSSRSHYWHHMQVGAYSMDPAWFEDGEIPYNAALLYLGKDGTYRYQVMKIGARDRWAAVITAYNLKHNRAGARS